MKKIYTSLQCIYITKHVAGRQPVVGSKSNKNKIQQQMSKSHWFTRDKIRKSKSVCVDSQRARPFQLKSQSLYIPKTPMISQRKFA